MFSAAYICQNAHGQICTVGFTFELAGKILHGSLPELIFVLPPYLLFPFQHVLISLFVHFMILVCFLVLRRRLYGPEQSRRPLRHHHRLARRSQGQRAIDALLSCILTKNPAIVLFLFQPIPSSAARALSLRFCAILSIQCIVCRFRGSDLLRKSRSSSSYMITAWLYYASAEEKS